MDKFDKFSSVMLMVIQSNASQSYHLSLVWLLVRKFGKCILMNTVDYLFNAQALILPLRYLEIMR